MKLDRRETVFIDLGSDAGAWEAALRAPGWQMRPDGAVERIGAVVADVPAIERVPGQRGPAYITRRPGLVVR